MDSVRAANTSVYGYKNSTTPFLNRFSDRATKFENVWAPSCWSLPSHTSMFTGLHVNQHNIVSSDKRLKEGVSVFNELDNKGYRTGIFSENVWLTEYDTGLKQGFDTIKGKQNVVFPEAKDPSKFVLDEGEGEYSKYLKSCLEDDYTIKSLFNGAYSKLAWDYPNLTGKFTSMSTSGDTYTDLFLDWLDENDENWGACINYIDAHAPYEPDEEHNKWGDNILNDIQANIEDKVWSFVSGEENWWKREALESLYDGCIRQLDAEIERLIKQLEQRNELDDTLVVITSDHGEGFGEVSNVGPDRRIAAHNYGIHESLLNVPLLVKLPSQSKGRQISKLSSITNIADIVRHYIKGMDGNPLEKLIPETVMATYAGLENQMEMSAKSYVDDISKYDTEGHAVYERHKDYIVKYQSWGNDYSIEIISQGTNDRMFESPKEVIDRKVINTSDVDVAVTDNREYIDKRTKKQLEELGYR
jgi:arylsulfatase